MKPSHQFVFLFLLCLGSIACAGLGDLLPTPDARATETKIAASIFATLTSTAPTATNTPTTTETPTAIASPSRAATTPSASLESTAAPSAPEVIVTSTLDSGWIDYQVRTSQFGLALPPTWKRLDLSSSGLDASIAVVGEMNPNFKTMFSSQTLRRLMSSGLRFFAVDLDRQTPDSQSPVSVNVLKIDLGMSLPTDYVISGTLAQVGKLADPSFPVTHQPVSLADTQAEQIMYHTRFTAPSGATTILALTQYVFADETFEYAITFGCPNDKSDVYNETFDRIARSFRLVR